jgi:hypothetical protein
LQTERAFAEKDEELIGAVPGPLRSAGKRLVFIRVAFRSDFSHDLVVTYSNDARWPTGGFNVLVDNTKAQ